jgi:DNA-binding PadR family transcriptional regulator
MSAELGGIWRIRQSQAYAVLKRLEKRGHLSASRIEQEKLPPIQVLKVTPAGRKHFAAWLETPTASSVRAIRLEFITRLYFAEKLAPDSVLQRIEEQAASVRATLERLELSLHSAAGNGKFSRLSQQLRIRQLRSTIAWIEACRQEFEAGKVEG